MQIYSDFFIDDYDIAILQLKKPVKMTKYAKTICLANKEPTEEDNVVLISGWGRTSEGGSQSDILMKGIVSIISRQKCSILYKKAVKTITNQMICAGSFGKDTCQGDSGGKYMQTILINSFFNTGGP